MKDKKLQIFVSSTFTDLRAERQAAVEAILSSGHIPAGMELFSAGDESQMSVIKRWIDESDVYLLILGGRYGSIDPISKKSYTHLEFEYAIEKKKPLFAVVIAKAALELRVKQYGTDVIEQLNGQALINFQADVVKNLVKFWDDEKDIKIAIHETLSDLNYREDLVGWIRGDNFVNGGFLAEEIARLTKENSELRIKLLDDKSDFFTVFAGLTYIQMKNLLEKEIFINSETQEKSNLFHFFITHGEILSIGKRSFGNKELFEKLVLFKLVRSEISLNSIGFQSPKTYFFTEEGHNFYLKSISLDMEEQ